MSVRLILMRHGKRAEGPGDPGLAPAGKTEAALTADALAQETTVSAVYASPLARALETGTLIAAALGLPLHIEPLLRERANWGDEAPCEGYDGSFESFVDIWGRASLERDWQPPVGDSARVAGARLERFAKGAASAHIGETVLAVTHGGLITDFLLNTVGRDGIASFCSSFDPRFGPDLRECSFTICTYDGRVVEVECVGDVSHLDPLENGRA